MLSIIMILTKKSKRQYQHGWLNITSKLSNINRQTSSNRFFPESYLNHFYVYYFYSIYFNFLITSKMFENKIKQIFSFQSNQVRIWTRNNFATKELQGKIAYETFFIFFFISKTPTHTLGYSKIRISLSKTCLNSYKSSIWLTSFIGLIVFQTYIIRFTVVHLTKGLHFQALCVGDKLYKKENFTSSESAWHVISIR